MPPDKSESYPILGGSRKLALQQMFRAAAGPAAALCYFVIIPFDIAGDGFANFAAATAALA